MQKIKLIITTPEKKFYEGDVDFITITSTEGELGILPGHLPMVAALSPSPVKLKNGEEIKEAAISGGFAKIDGSEVVIIADTAEWPEEIEVNRAREAKQRAEERMQERLSEIEYLRTKIAFQRALVRLKVSNKDNQNKMR